MTAFTVIVESDQGLGVEHRHQTIESPTTYLAFGYGVGESLEAILS